MIFFWDLKIFLLLKKSLELFFEDLKNFSTFFGDLKNFSILKLVFRQTCFPNSSRSKKIFGIISVRAKSY